MIEVVFAYDLYHINPNTHSIESSQLIEEIGPGGILFRAVRVWVMGWRFDNDSSENIYTLGFKMGTIFL